MFKIYYKGLFVGESRLEHGDAPMGCANGQLIWRISPAVLRGKIVPFSEADGARERWTGLRAETANGAAIEAKDVVLYHLRDNPDFPTEVDVIGVESALYARLFPQHLTSCHSAS